MDPKDKVKFLVFLLVTEYRAKQVDVSRVFNVSPATISLWMKEMKLRFQIHNLEVEVSELRQIASAYMASGQIGTSRDYNLIPQIL